MRLSERHFGHSNTVLAVVGGASAAAVRDAVRRHFRFGRPTRRQPVPRVRLRTGGRVRLRDDESSQAYLTMLLCVPPRHRDAARHRRGARHRRADPDSRLFQELRERLGLSYEVGAHLEWGPDWALAAFSASGARSQADRLVRAVADTCRRAADEGFTADELERARKKLRYRYAVLADSRLDQAIALAESALWNFPTPQETESHRRDAVGVRDRDRLAPRRVGEKRHRAPVLVAPLADARRGGWPGPKTASLRRRLWYRWTMRSQSMSATAAIAALQATTSDDGWSAAVLDRETCYRALLSRDARFDGRFFIGVRTTGVYCRPDLSGALHRSWRMSTSTPAPPRPKRQAFAPVCAVVPRVSPGTPAWLGTSATVSRALRLISDGAVSREASASSPTVSESASASCAACSSDTSALRRWRYCVPNAFISPCG